MPKGGTALESKHRIVQVAFDGKAFLAFSASGRIAVWDVGRRVARVLGRGWSALADDGSVALAVVQGAGRGVVLEVWDLASDKKVGARAFGLGLAGFSRQPLLTVSRRMVVLREGAPECDDCETIQKPPSPTIIPWEVATGKDAHQLIDQSCGDDSMLSRDGRYHLCVSRDGGHVSWADLLDYRGSDVHGPAPDWWPPSREVEEEELLADPKHFIPPSPLAHITSARLSRDGTAVYLAYRRSGHPDVPGGRAPARGWRLERWTPSPSRREEPAKVKLLASAPVQLCSKVLAVSPDGRLLILGGAGYPATARRAPDYAASPLGEDTEALAAAFSLDGAWFVTGHPDGHLTSWSAQTLQPVLTSTPAWETAGSANREERRNGAGE